MTYKLYELSDRISEIEECLEMLEGTDIPKDLHQDYLGLLEELDQTEEAFNNKVDGILSLIQSRKRWLEVRKAESKRLQELIKRDENTIEWLRKYLQEHLERQGIKKLRTNKFNLSIRKASTAPLELKFEDASKFPKKYQRVTIEVDKQLLREQIKNGVDVSKWCSLGERSSYLSIR
jgi:hypothetical protein